MTTQRAPRRCAQLAAVCSAALAALTLTAAGAPAAGAATAPAGSDPVVTTSAGAVRGTTAGTVDEFLGIPYAAPPTGNLRWRPPVPAAGWRGVRDATSFGASCPQATEKNPFLPPGPISEDCLYLNVYAPATHPAGHRPVLVWIHGGGLVQDGGRNYAGPSSRPTARSWSQSTTGSARSASWPTRRSLSGPVARPATTA